MSSKHFAASFFVFTMARTHPKGPRTRKTHEELKAWAAELKQRRRDANPGKTDEDLEEMRKKEVAEIIAKDNARREKERAEKIKKKLEESDNDNSEEYVVSDYGGCGYDGRDNFRIRMVQRQNTSLYRAHLESYEFYKQAASSQIEPIIKFDKAIHKFELDYKGKYW